MGTSNSEASPGLTATEECSRHLIDSGAIHSTLPDSCLDFV
jgi:hypothetical protein